MDLHSLARASTVVALATVLFIGSAKAGAGEREFDPKAALDTVGEDRAAQVFEETCQACHGAGEAFMGAPTIGDLDSWDWRVEARGFDMLVENTIDGLGAMPPRGGDGSLSDEEVAASIAYMMVEGTDLEVDEIVDLEGDDI